MNALEKDALDAVAQLSSVIAPPRVKELIPKLMKLGELILDEDPNIADYLQSILDIGEADIQGQVAAKGG